MKYPSKEDVQKLGVISRSFSSFGFICGVVAIASGVYGLFIGQFDLTMLFLIVFSILFTYITGVISFTGYAPKFLLFTHGPKKDS